MGQKDLQQSEYFDSNVRFADAYNGILFDGNPIIKPEELEECDSVFVQLFETQKGQKIIADKVKKWRGQHLAILPVETQNYVDYRMVLRIMLEEIMAYEKQRKQALANLDLIGQKLEAGNEFLSEMKKEWKFAPVIPLIIYLGKDEAWDAATTLYELLDIDENLKPFVNNYKINLYDYHDSKDFSKFKTENRFLFELLSNRNNQEKIETIFHEAYHDYDLDRRASETLLKLADINIDLDSIKVYENGKEKYDVCKAIDDMKQTAREEGFKSGVQQGTLLTLYDLVTLGNISLEVAASKVSMTPETFLNTVKLYTC